VFCNLVVLPVHVTCFIDDDDDDFTQFLIGKV